MFLTRKEKPGVSPTQNQRVRGERRDQVGWEPSVPLRVCTGLSSCSEAAPEALEVHSESSLHRALKVRAATFLLLHTLRVCNKNAAKRGKAARVSSALWGSSEQVPAAVKSIQFKRVLTGSSAPNKQQRLKAVSGAQQWFKTWGDSWAPTGSRPEVWVLGFAGILSGGTQPAICFFKRCICPAQELAWVWKCIQDLQVVPPAVAALGCAPTQMCCPPLGSLNQQFHINIGANSGNHWGWQGRLWRVWKPKDHKCTELQMSWTL